MPQEPVVPIHYGGGLKPACSWHDDEIAITTNPGEVTCFACRKTEAFKATRPSMPMRLREVMAESPEFQALDRREGYDEQLHRDQRRRWTIECVAGDTDLGYMDWLRQKLGVGQPTLHNPPYMNDMNDGVFRFHGTHSDIRGEMEVIPMTTGNVEFEIRDNDSGKGMIFNLSHLDRMDLVRALLHDFHYSPEQGGPND